MTPTGNEQAQVEMLLEKSNRMVTQILTLPLNRMESYLAYQAVWLPSITYSLGNTTISESQLQQIQSRATQSFLAKLGINQNFPRVAAFGPEEYGGMGLRDLVTEQGTAQIYLLLTHIYNATSVGKMILIALNTSQLEAGTAQGLLESPTRITNYETSCWIMSL